MPMRAIVQRHKRKKVQAVANLKPSEIFLAVHRLDDSVYFRRLDREEFAILKELGEGRTLGRALELASRNTQIPLAERPGEVARWFHAWAALRSRWPREWLLSFPSPSVMRVLMKAPDAT